MTLNTAGRAFLRTLWFIMTHKHLTFGCERLVCSSEVTGKRQTTTCSKCEPSLWLNLKDGSNCCHNTCKELKIQNISDVSMCRGAETNLSDLDLEDSSPIQHTTLQLMMLCHCTKFYFKRFRKCIPGKPGTHRLTDKAIPTNPTPTHPTLLWGCK